MGPPIRSIDPSSHILVVDDEPHIRNILSARLGMRGYRVTLAASGPEALAKIKDDPPQVILADLMMPGMSGLDLCREVKADPALKDIYIIILTARGDTETKIRGLSIGGDDYITKPFDFGELVARIEVGLRTFRLIQELKHTNEELRRTREQVIQQTKLASVGRLAAGLAHEINNPLEAISNYVQVLLKKREERPPQELEALSHIHSETIRIARLIRNLLTFSRGDKLSFFPLQINRVIQDATILVRPQYEAEGKHLELDLKEGIPLVKGSPSHLQQVFINMMNNARQAMDKDGKLTIRTSLVNQDSARVVQIDFTDTGRGIPEEIKKHLFEPFFTTKEAQKGTGLGLYVSYLIVQRHGGNICVESSPGKGARFSIQLPLGPEQG